jgi:hypothetical protein
VNFLPGRTFDFAAHNTKVSHRNHVLNCWHRNTNCCTPWRHVYDLSQIPNFIGSLSLWNRKLNIGLIQTPCICITSYKENHNINCIFLKRSLAMHNFMTILNVTSIAFTWCVCPLLSLWETGKSEFVIAAGVFHIKFYRNPSSPTCVHFMQRTHNEEQQRSETVEVISRETWRETHWR